MPWKGFYNRWIDIGSLSFWFGVVESAPASVTEIE